ncbi:MAG: hypothetical protein IT372_21270 [Polyangiaceae bacterium]|nr:hypothetical protein [Polyangiaceae bacterium]
MSKDALVKAVKVIVALARDGKFDEAYEGYARLFESPEFAACRPEDQRQALRLMVLAKGAPPQPTPAMLRAHRSAVAPLTELVSVHGDPGDHEMLGLCHELLGNLESADRIYRAGLALERERNAQSDLCGSLMKRISLL